MMASNTRSKSESSSNDGDLEDSDAVDEIKMKMQERVGEFTYFALIQKSWTSRP